MNTPPDKRTAAVFSELDFVQMNKTQVQRSKQSEWKQTGMIWDTPSLFHFSTQ